MSDESRLRAADAMAAAIDREIRAGRLSSRSTIADARLNYSEPFAEIDAGELEDARGDPHLRNLGAAADQHPQKLQEEGRMLDEEDTGLRGALDRVDELRIAIDRALAVRNPAGDPMDGFRAYDEMRAILTKAVSSMEPPPPVAPEGWYPDPEHPGEKRFWDGANWTGARSGPEPVLSSETRALAKRVAERYGVKRRTSIMDTTPGAACYDHGDAAMFGGICLRCCSPALGQLDARLLEMLKEAVSTIEDHLAEAIEGAATPVPEIAIRRTRGGQLDDVVVKPVTMFRAERMSTDPDVWWLCCYLPGGERITWNVLGRGLHMDVGEMPNYFEDLDDVDK